MVLAIAQAGVKAERRLTIGTRRAIFSFRTSSFSAVTQACQDDHDHHQSKRRRFGYGCNILSKSHLTSRQQYAAWKWRSNTQTDIRGSRSRKRKNFYA